MDFFKLLQSLDELLYEIMSWLIFYPVTLWRAIARPRVMMDYADSELGDAQDDQYTDTLSPPLFLILTLLISHAIELAVVGENRIVASNAGLSALISTDTNLVLLRVVTFSLFPLILAVRLVRKQRLGLDRKTLKAPFYSQCYVTAPFALLIGVATIVVQLPELWLQVAGVAMFAIAFLWFGTLQVGWFARHLGVSRWRGFWNASLAMIEGIIGMVAIGWMFG